MILANFTHLLNSLKVVSHANFRVAKQAKTTISDPWPHDKQSSIREVIAEEDLIKEIVDFRWQWRITLNNLDIIDKTIWNWQTTMENLEEVHIIQDEIELQLKL